MAYPDSPRRGREGQSNMQAIQRSRSDLAPLSCRKETPAHMEGRISLIQQKRVVIKLNLPGSTFSCMLAATLFDIPWFI
jgi:hypothetical protein